MRAALLALVACSASSAPAPAPMPVPVAIVVDAASLDAPPPIDATPPEPHRPAPRAVNEALKALQAKLGPATARTCEGVAKLLAAQGEASDAKLRTREKAILKTCVATRWPEHVRTCVAEADHDPLSCTAYFETKAQRAQWNQIFNTW